MEKGLFAGVFLSIGLLGAVLPAQAQTFHVSRDHYLVAGDKALAAGDYQAALKHFQRALHKDITAAERVSAQNSVCAINYVLGQYDQAETACSTAIGADNGYWKAYVNRGNARNAQGDVDGALADYCKAHSLRPGYVSGDFVAYCPA